MITKEVMNTSNAPQPRLPFSAIFFTFAVCSAASAQISNIAVTSAADYSLGVPAPGGAASIFCTGLSVTGIQRATFLPLPFNLAGVQVTIGGFPAPRYAVASVGDSQQINVQVPAELVYASTLSTSVVVTQGGQSGSIMASLIVDNPGQLFSFPNADPNAVPAGIFQRFSDYSLITSTNPAKSGDILIVYGSGLCAGIPSSD